MTSRSELSDILLSLHAMSVNVVTVVRNPILENGKELSGFHITVNSFMKTDNVRAMTCGAEAKFGGVV